MSVSFESNDNGKYSILMKNVDITNLKSNGNVDKEVNEIVLADVPFYDM